ncbi:MAG TPA: hypothetical protein VLA12_21615 [Planctomycetaceae bacterium]|nr:hypothetical protein [Planctomycetaceae bacterium]
MNRSFLTGCCVILTGACLSSPGWGEDTAPPPLPFRISPETTYVTEPLTPTGLVNYVAWLNRDLSQGVTPETNAAVLYWKAIGKNEGILEDPEFVARLIRGLGTDPFADEGPTFIGLDRIARAAGVEVDFNEESTLGSQYNLAMERPWKPHEAPLVYKWLYVNKEPLETVLQGTKRPHYYRPLFGTVDNDTMFGLRFPEIQPFRELARMLSARTLLALGEHRPEDAMRDLLAMHRLARHSARGGTLMSVLVGIAVDSIAHEGDKQLSNSEAVTAGQLVRYAKQLSELSPWGDLQRSYQFERFAGLDLIQRLASQQFPGDDGDDDPTGLLELFGVETDSEVVNQLISLLFQHGVDWNQVMIGFNEHHDRLQGILNQIDYAERFQELSDLAEELETRSHAVSSHRTLVASLFATPQQRAEVLTAMLIYALSPALRQADEAGNRGNAKSVVSQVGVALAAYQKANGEFPASLEALVPDYLPKLPNDPYIGKPCVYRVDDEGAIVYSLGRNLKDDGGKSLRDDYDNHDHPFRVTTVDAPLPNR